MRPLLLFYLNACLFFPTLGQEWSPSAVISVQDLNLVSTDNQGFLFTSDSNGNILQFDNKGVIINNFSPPRQGRLNQLEASWTVNIFSFSADLQEYRILDRFLNPISENRISQEHVGLAKAATLGNNNIIWILDESDISLKQFDYRRNQMLQNQPLSLVLDNIILDIIDIREYQNLLFLNIKNEGVYIFDNQGNFIRLLKRHIPQGLSFWKGNLVFVENQEIALVDYRSGVGEKFSLPFLNPNQKILMHNDLVMLYGDNQIKIYEIKNTSLSGIGLR